MPDCLEGAYINGKGYGRECQLSTWSLGLWEPPNMEYRATILPGAHTSSSFTPARSIIPIGKFSYRTRVSTYGPIRCSYSGPPPSSTSQGTQDRVDVAQRSQSSYLAMWQNARQRQEEERRERDRVAATEAEERRAVEVERITSERRAVQFASILEV